MWRPALVACLLIFIASHASAWTWHIKPDGTGDAPTITAGADSAASGDTLLLANGVFTGAGNKNVSIFGMTLHIISESGDPALCVIDCGGSGTCITYSGWPEYGTGSGTVKGIKITRAGTAIRTEYAAGASVVNCILTGNTGLVVTTAGAPSVAYSSVGLTDCVVSSNPSVVLTAEYKCTVGASHCVFTGNGPVLRVSPWRADGGLYSCTVVGNYDDGGGVIGFQTGAMGGAITVHNSIVASNIGQAIACGFGSVSLECTDIWDNSGGDYVGCIAEKNGVDGNFSGDPLFCGPESGDFTIQLDSPCAPGNHPDGAACGTIGALPAACGTPTEPTTWGAIKSMYE